MPRQQPDLKLANLTTAQLEKQLKQLKGILVGLGIVMLAATGILLYFVSKSGKWGLAGIIPALFLTLFPGFIRLAQLNSELKSREQK